MSMNKRDITDEERKLAVILVVIHDVDIKKVAKIFGFQTRAVREWIKRFEDEIPQREYKKDIETVELTTQIQELQSDLKVIKSMIINLANGVFLTH